ncbi:unnamed protein product [Rotaria sordida]|uniref:hydroxyacylglutathione hydrolase n=1 Tax=Rotaria sordida TaxID=392033 RepID=A0A813VZE9_9BILA|nr:unnamed protein product [Rotaria sordida]CAF0889640.1 unnamed protein product [Rotaria sordida]
MFVRQQLVLKFSSLVNKLYYRTMKIRHFNALKDNYMYLITDDKTTECAVVDPAEPKELVETIKKEGLKLTTILTTHHHYDHAGGNNKMLELMGAEKGQIKVVGGDESLQGLTHLVQDNEKIQIGELEVTCLLTPCHTAGHVCYLVTDKQQQAVFTGDTLFIGGCGKFFEGSAAQMQSSLQKLAGLDPKTLVYCGHEYTKTNLEFAATVEPDNQDLKAKQASLKSVTIPSTIGDELKFNPFMRTNQKSVQAFTGKADPIECMGELRERKNKF